MLRLLDRLAGKWMDVRCRQGVEAFEELRLHRLEVGDRGYEIVASHPAIYMFASGAAEMLDEASADNYVQFDMMPRPDHALKAIRITVQWANGLSPAQKALDLEAQIAHLIELTAALQDALETDNRDRANEAWRALPNELVKRIEAQEEP